MEGINIKMDTEIDDNIHVTYKDNLYSFREFQDDICYYDTSVPPTSILTYLVQRSGTVQDDFKNSQQQT